MLFGELNHSVYSFPERGEELGNTEPHIYAFVFQSFKELVSGIDEVLKHLRRHDHIICIDLVFCPFRSQTS